MYVGILDAQGEVLVHKNLKANPEAFLDAIAPYAEYGVGTNRTETRPSRPGAAIGQESSIT